MKNVFLGALLFCSSAGLQAADEFVNESVTVLGTELQGCGVVIVIDSASFKIKVHAEALAEMLKERQKERRYSFSYAFSFDRRPAPPYELLDNIFAYASGGSYRSKSKNFREIPFPTSSDGFIGLINRHPRQNIILIAQSSHVPGIIQASAEHGYRVASFAASMDVEGEKISPVDELACLLGKLGL